VESEAWLGADPASPAASPAIAPLDIPVAAPAEVPPPAAAPARPPGIGETISGALDLAASSNGAIRRTSLYVGLLSVALIGPAIVLFLAIGHSLGSFEDALLFVFGLDNTIGSDRLPVLSWLRLSAVTGIIGLFLIAFEGQLMAVSILGGTATGRSIDLRQALRLSRRVYWVAFGAAFLVGILERVATTITQTIATDATSSPGLAASLVIIAAAIVTMPFGFYLSGVILGAVGAWEAIKRSTWIARARWRLAILVASIGVVLSFIELFALSAGLDLVGRAAEALGLGLDKSLPIAVLTGIVVLACVAAVGSLIVTIAALVAAPQVFVFLRMTTYSAGLDRAQPPASESGTGPRLVTRPMLAMIIVGAVSALVGLLSL
jgi:hypothetical protein